MTKDARLSELETALELQTAVNLYNVAIERAHRAEERSHALEAKLTALQDLATKWQEMALHEEDPAVAWARKSCIADVRALLKVKP